ncbi:Tudor domain-containing protein 1 [Habropoda laboriosa]|uniref:Tudor domain-containing protein 1 n=1 Tax=Habropoda laboriosa TaxID=597456 RepID=A0A0L7RJI9_9HYME|nr:Tudor domain-containing protein 1 [Habropoda laboriosa]
MLFFEFIPPNFIEILGSQHGLLQIFNHYGHIKGHFYRPNASWAYITYGTYLEAENAIKDLHNKSPLHLQISFAKEKGSSEVATVKTSAFKNVAQQSENHNVTAVTFANKSLGPGKPLNVFKGIEPNPTLPQYICIEDDDLLYPYPSDAHTYNPYENAEPYASTNTLWTRGKLTVTPDGKRHVSLGRGYTMYDIPYPDPEVHSYISSVYEKRNSDSYEYGEDMLQSAVKVCKLCSKKTKFACERCYYTFYCSKDCLVKDWPRHKVECEAIPSLVMAMQSRPTPQSNTREQTSIKSISNVQIPLRRPKNIQHIKHTENKIDKIRIPEKNHSSLPEKPLQREIQNQNAISDSKDLDSHKKWQKFHTDNVQKIEDDISFSKHTFLSTSEFKDVRIVIKENRDFWVQKVEDEFEIMELMSNLQKDADKAQIVEPINRNVYAVKFENIWHRALITSLFPTKIHYIDFGNDETVLSTEEFREINKYKNIPRFSAKIRLSDAAYEKYKDLKYDNVISVKMISIDSNEVINVEVKDENNKSMPKVTQINNNPIPQIPNTSKANDEPLVTSKTSINNNISNTFNKLKSIISTLTVGKTGFLEFGAELKNNTYRTILMPNDAAPDYEKLQVHLSTICSQMTKHTNHSPNIGDIICGLIANQWYRGCVLSLEPSLKMALIDGSNVQTVDKTLPCPENFLDICTFGAICEVIDAKYKFSTYDSHKFKVITQNVNKEQDKIEIEIIKGKDKLKAFVKPWIPMPEQTGIQYAELKNGSEVCIMAYRSHTLLFVRSLDTAELEHYNSVMQKVAKCAQTSAFLEEPPVVGQMVIAKYDDTNYYRAIVTKIEDDKIAITYVDFGNTEFTNIKKLKSLTDDLKQLHSCITKVTLNDVPEDVPMTKDVSDYLSHLVGTEVRLTCTFNGIHSKDGVHLKLHTGESVNKKISELLVPTSKKSAEEDKTCYLLNDISSARLGNNGDIITAVILYCLGDYMYAMCPLDYDMMYHVFNTLSEKINAYCKTSDHYIPREEELCLALYKDGWYRAACVCRSSTPTTSSLFFIDYGNTEDINHKDIRLMPREFITAPAVASICNIINAADHDGHRSPKIKEILEQEATGSIDSVPVTIKIVNYDLESGMYKVELHD